MKKLITIITFVSLSLSSFSQTDSVSIESNKKLQESLVDEVSKNDIQSDNLKLSNSVGRKFENKLLILNRYENNQMISDTVGLLRSESNWNNILERYMFTNFVELYKPISLKEKNYLISKFGNFDEVDYQFKYASYYLKQSTVFKERSIKIHRTTRIIGGYILPLLGTIVTFNYSSKIGAPIMIAGFLTAEIGFHVSLSLDSQSNKLISKASNKLKSLE